MSDFSLLSTDMSLWDPSTKATWGSLDFCPVVTWFQVCMQSLKGSWPPSPRQGLWGDVEKPHAGYGICFNSTKPSHQVWVGLWPNSHVGASSPSPPTHSGGGSPGSWCCWLTKVPTGHMPMHGWMMLWPMCLCPVRGTLALWLKAYLAGMPVQPPEPITGAEDYCNAEAGWFALRGWMGALKLCCLTLRNYHSGMWPMQMNPPEICPW